MKWRQSKKDRIVAEAKELVASELREIIDEMKRTNVDFLKDFEDEKVKAKLEIYARLGAALSALEELYKQERI